MRVVDLTHTLGSDISVYPGTEQPTFEQTNTIDKDGFAETLISMYSHVGTHIDAPAHIIKGGKPLDKFAPESFIGKAICIDCKNISGHKITLNFIKQFENNINKVDFVLLDTGWDKKWNTPDYFHDFLVMENEACKWLASKNLKGVGIDAISIDPISSTNLTNHQYILNSEMIIIENLCKLNQLQADRPFLFSCLPLKYKNSNGSPARAVAIFKQ